MTPMLRWALYEQDGKTMRAEGVMDAEMLPGSVPLLRTTQLLILTLAAGGLAAAPEPTEPASGIPLEQRVKRLEALSERLLVMPASGDRDADNWRQMVDATNPDRWNVEGSPEEQVRMRAALTYLHGAARTGLAGGRIP